MEPVLIEAFMWIALLISTPAIWWVFSTVGTILGEVFFPGKVVEIKYEDDQGEIVIKKINLDDDDELVKVLLCAKKQRSGGMNG